MSKKAIRDELLKANAELGTTIHLLNRESVPQTRRKLQTIHRRTRRALNLLNRRSEQGTGKVSNPQAPPVTPNVTIPVSKLLPLAKVDWVRLRSDLKSGLLSYGSIARSMGKPTRYRGLIYNVINGKKAVSKATQQIVSAWALDHGYLSSGKKGR